MHRWQPAALSLALAAPMFAAAGPVAAQAAGGVSVVSGSTPETTVFPNDRFTVIDTGQLSGKRINLPMPTCTATSYSACDDVRVLNSLDGFDLQPRVSIPFSGPIQLDSVNSTTVYVEGPEGRTGLQQIVYDPATNTVAGITVNFLHEDTTYTIVVVGGSAAGVLNDTGHPIAATVRTPFTTDSGSSKLDMIRRSLDSGVAYTQAGIDKTKRASFTQGPTTTVFPATAGQLISRQDQTNATPGSAKTNSTVPNAAVAGVRCYAFGSIESPQFVTGNAVIPPVATSQAPPARPKGGADQPNNERIGFALIVPAGTVPPGGWPVAVFGPGFSRSYFDVFLAADQNAARGIATIATEPLGHGFGPESTVTVGGTVPPTTFLSYGRGHDLNQDGKIDSTEGVQPTNVGTTPSPQAIIANSDGLIQTAADNMALVRSIETGIDVPSCGGATVPLKRGKGSGVQYYGQSFGGIYGTMLMGTDPEVRDGLLNVPGGPILDIARLSSFRPLVAGTLGVNKPSLLNGGPGLNGFTEAIPLANDPRVTAPAAGAIPIQQYFARTSWASRPGNPETFAPLLRLRPRADVGAKIVEFQVAFGDHTVPNPTTGTLIRAGALADRVTYYRNDETASFAINPHGYLLDPRLAGRTQAQQQLVEFLFSHGANVTNPSLPGTNVFEVPIVNANNLRCLHYPDPQTGQTAYPDSTPPGPPAAGECPPAPAEPRGRSAVDRRVDGTAQTAGNGGSASRPAVAVAAAASFTG